MQRRDFNKTALAAATVAVTATGCGGGADSAVVADSGAGSTALAAAKPLAAPLRAPASPAIGVNLSGMEWAETGMRFGGGTAPNIHYTVPRKQDVAYLASQGITKTRLVIKWEMLQPMLFDTVANAASKAAIGQPGGFDLGYGLQILDILDAHAAAGIKCIIDLHNYCRYRDFVYQPDGSVIGLVKPSDPTVRAYTTDNAQVRTRIFATAPGATLTAAHLSNFWTGVAGYVKNHPGFGGYGLMNEPYFMPRPGELVEAYQGFGEDLTIWPTVAQQAINAIRAVDPTNPIYLGGNDYSAMFTIADNNPGWPLSGANIVYEVHGYLDAYSNGQSFDWDAEVAKGYTAGVANAPITLNTGLERLRIAVNWSIAKGVKLAVTETGMPIDDARWQESYQRMVDYAHANNVEVFNWLGGSHWLLHSNGINHVPSWYQNKTLEPQAAGPLKKSAGISQAVLFDGGPGYAAAGGSVTITVFARGNLATPVTLNVASSNGGSFSKTTLTIPAGANGSDSYTFTPAPNSVTTLSYSAVSGGLNTPPSRKVYALTDPVAYASTSLADAGMALIAKYSAAKWDMGDGYTDYLSGVPAGTGQPLRAVSDSGYASSASNAMEMINWTNTDRPGSGGVQHPPVLRDVSGLKISDHTQPDTYGLWCRKQTPVAGSNPNPRNRVPYDLQDAHFVIAAVGVPTPSCSGTMFQASYAQGSQAAEINFDASRPQAKWTNAAGQAVTITSPTALAPNTPNVVTMTSASGAQALRLNKNVVGTSATPLPTASFDQMLLGWGFSNFYPQTGFGGYIKAVVTGRGAPTAAELLVMERYVGSLAGMSL
ncbi:glycoside hydrolase family 5 protein [Caenimonas aquaedulcis]|uniref:Cellulase family glycosylhydrolase n=1 Tax=Caenimonas aquaedulcis TaxID=2793270 RepID=A0A931ME13_9BURK|nr:cellulase family glycosylhydrolase [Caenimonas aquaedulcis]MBG9386476.1 cellulase family glycosylhydrolase [Caenimonas aquaedulcis]